ncbi:MAG: ATP-dependent Clp protease ATP-binding subunit [Myxococcales bacterium]|nr:ATP-dependent Clp protease ATP-binding subunit [Myxococcales bacterium]
MTLPPDDDKLKQVLDEASNFAARAGVPYCSAHLLLALLAADDASANLLNDRGLDASRIVRHLGEIGSSELSRSEAEPDDMLQQIRDRARRMAQSCGSRAVGTLHLLLALASLRGCIAYRVLAAAGIDPASLRAIALALITGGPERLAAQRRRAAAAAAAAAATTTTTTTATAADDERDGATGDAMAGDAAPGDDDEPVRQGLLRTGGAATPRRGQPDGGGGAPPPTDPRITRGLERADGAADADEAASRRALPASRYALDEERYPTLAMLCRNLSLAAESNQIEPLIGRRELVEQILDILGKRRANNPCLIGEPGVGKTAIVEGLAYLQVKHPDEVPFLDGKILVELNMGALLSGTQLRGAFSERMAALRDEVEAADGSVILFLDEIHTLVGAGAVGDGSLDAVGELSAAMARGHFPCVGATTSDHYRKSIEETPALHRRLQPVLVPEPESDEALAIIAGVAPAYAEHHTIDFSPDAYEAAVRLSSRYITDRFLPDKAISLLDLAGSRARRRGKQAVGRAELAELVAERTEIPAERLLMSDTERFLQMEGFISKHIIGHDKIIKRVSEVIRRNYAGFSSDRPIGSFLLLGPTGVGKTELVKVLADFLFQSRDALCRLDMSEYMEPHTVARLIGSPPGYVGHEEGGQLTESVRRKPYQIVLLDEVEKAHRDVLQVLLQLLDDGRLTDGRGRTVDFSNTVVVMTSNLGSEHYDRRRGHIGFGLGVGAPSGDNEATLTDEEWKRIVDEVLTTARRAFPIELWNRIEERIVFEPLTRAQILEVARLLVADSARRLAAEKQISYVATDAALDYLIDNGGYDPLLGARPMRTTIQRLIEGPVAEQILLGKAKPGDELRVDCVDGKLVVDKRVA